MNKVWIKWREGSSGDFDFELLDLDDMDADTFAVCDEFPQTEAAFTTMMNNWVSNEMASMYGDRYFGSESSEWTLVDKPSLEWVRQQQKYASCRLLDARTDFNRAFSLEESYYPDAVQDSSNDS